MSDKYLSTRHQASLIGTTTISAVTITHPFHPLHGQKLEVIKVLRGENSKIVVRLPNGKHSRMLREWTDYDASKVNQTSADHPCLLDIKGLREVVQIINNIKPERSSWSGEDRNEL
jgi:hypothetical protein